MKSSVILVLAICGSFSVAVLTDKLVQWRFDERELPEMLPKYMRGKSNEEIKKAVYKAYENQMKIISEYSGHIYDTEYPYGYLKNEYFVPDTRGFQPDHDLIFYNNVVRGLRDYKKNDIVLKFASDQIDTAVEWRNANIRGYYYYSNSTYFEQGKYHIQLDNLKYMANTTFSENTVNYPIFMDTNSSIYYDSFRASFSGNLPEVTDVNEMSNLKYFLKDVAFPQISYGVDKSMYNNITVAIREAVKPYMFFQNASESNFKGFTGKLTSGVQYKVDDINAYGFNQTYSRVKDVIVDVANKNVTGVAEYVVHKLNGYFTLHADESKPYSGKVHFDVYRINVIGVSNMLNPKENTVHCTVHNVQVEISSELSLTHEVNKILEKDFACYLENAFKSVVSSALAGMYNNEARDY